MLVPLLQVWLSTTREYGYIERPYSEICQLLRITSYAHLSKILEKLAPSMNELQANGYLASWRVEKQTRGSDFKLVLYHGDRFRRSAIAPVVPPSRI